ncbi:uncharacterized protein LOC125758665 [Rhipicephalus sanguineus]|uniref:uncharacterized protein LOC125758665 n=1 Tax=Rhipicephalus sanguineus TaxID=34632 RepID=UPI0020C4FA7E|nr:uncharacterized protein LOC125758665 [Rhipicephalus sanguineus]
MGAAVRFDRESKSEEIQGSLRCSDGMSEIVMAMAPLADIDEQTGSEANGERDRASASECFRPERKHLECTIIDAFHDVLDLACLVQSQVDELAEEEHIFYVACESLIFSLYAATQALLSTKPTHSRTAKDLLLPPPPTVENSAVAYIAGFIAKAVEERRTCNACPGLHTSGPSRSTVIGLISQQTRGALVFPKPEFVAVLVNVKKAVDIALPHIGKEDVCKRLTALISPDLLSCPLFGCPEREDHSSVTCSIVANKFIRPLLSNVATNITDRVPYRKKLINKPLSREVLRV